MTNTRNIWSILLILIAVASFCMMVRIVLSVLRRQPTKQISEKRRLIGDFLALNMPMRKSMNRIVALKSGGML
jgi:hypothetical protein